jgi:DNA-binding LacI/PurR family transcriptional regulator
VTVDHKPAINAAMARLSDLGHRSVLYVTRPHYLHTIRALELEKAGDAQGLRVAVEAVAYDSPDDAYSDLLAEQLARTNPPTALFTDTGALLFMVQALDSMGLSSPADISVVTFDESLWHRRLGLPWSSICFDLRELGMVAGRLMTEWLAGYPPPKLTIAASYELVERKSIGPAPVRADGVRAVPRS